jgi:hypothetical protein
MFRRQAKKKKAARMTTFAPKIIISLSNSGTPPGIAEFEKAVQQSVERNLKSTAANVSELIRTGKLTPNEARV